jgi:uncharacterized protein (DUF1697 family)
MRYVALLRGINVGGNHIVAMSELKTVFEAAGMTDVRTYINSGNVIFSSRSLEQRKLTGRLQKAIAAHFGFEIPVLVLDIEKLRSILSTLPDTWVNDKTMRCDVLFLWPEVDNPGVLKGLKIRPELEDVVYTPGAIIWRIDRVNATKSGLVKIIGTPLYRQLTGRNCNTARKLLQLMDA